MAARDNKSRGDSNTATGQVESTGQGRSNRIKSIENYLPENKTDMPHFEAVERFGVLGKPLPATDCFVKEIAHNRKEVLAETWIIINDKANTMSFVNTFDGKTGPNFNQEQFTFPIDVAKLNEKRSGMEKVPVDECPVAIPVDEAGR